MWQALQHQWEDDFNALFSENVDLPRFAKMDNRQFCPVEITGFDSYNISFRSTVLLIPFFSSYLWKFCKCF